MNSFENEYSNSKVVEWFHNFPHINISFDSVNKTFDPTNEEYIEALGILAAVPAFWLILTLLAFLIFFLVRCCSTNWKKRKDLKGLKFTLAIFALLCCGGLAVGLYGNHQAHNGVEQVEGAIRHISENLKSIQNETKLMENIIKLKMNPDLRKLKRIFSKSKQNTTAHTIVQHTFELLTKNVSKGLTDVKNINDRVESLHIQKVPKYINEVEMYRWPATMALLSLFILLCLVLIIAVARSSRGLLICFSVFGLLAVVVCWILVSAYLVICVADSDFCKNPEAVFEDNLNNVVQRDIFQYYMECQESKYLSPFADAINSGKRAVEDIKSTLSALRKISLTIYGKQILEPIKDLNRDVKDVSKVLDELNVLLNCESIHHDYITSMDALCNNFIEGFSFMLLSSITCALIFTILIWISSHTWIYIRKRQNSETVDEADPFLPPSVAMRRGRDTSSIVSGYSSGGRDMYGSTGYVRPRYTHTPPQTPHFATYNGRSRNAFEEYPLPMHGRLTPPPSYELPNHYIKA